MNAKVQTPSIKMLELTSRGALVVIWLYYFTMATLAIWTLDAVASPYPTLIAVVLFGMTCLAITRSHSDRISLALSVIVIAVGVTGALIVSWQLEHHGGYAQWYFGTSVAGLFLVGLRGRIGVSWIGFALVGSVIFAWGVTTGLSWSQALFMVVQQAPILIVGTLFALGLRRAGAQVQRFAAEAAERAITEGEQRAISQEREYRLRTLGGVVSPMLELLARGDVPTAEQRVEFSLAEAELRDSLRARSLADTEVTAAAREARRRGVEVILLDDSDPTVLGQQDLLTVAKRIASVLDGVRSGRVTVRLLPPGRANLVTIVADGAEHAREDIATVR